MALAMFLVHNLIDFSLFEPGPMMAFAFSAGSVLGVRTAVGGGAEEADGMAAVALGVRSCCGWSAAGFVWSPTAAAEDAVDDGGVALRGGRAAEAVRLYARRGCSSR